jgi:hypothetical protein
MLRQIKTYKLLALILLFLSFQKILANNLGTTNSLYQITYIDILELESLRLERNFNFKGLLDEFISLLHKTNLSQEKRLLELTHNEINLGLERASVQYIKNNSNHSLQDWYQYILKQFKKKFKYTPIIFESYRPSNIKNITKLIKSYSEFIEKTQKDTIVSGYLSPLTFKLPESLDHFSVSSIEDSCEKFLISEIDFSSPESLQKKIEGWHHLLVSTDLVLQDRLIDLVQEYLLNYRKFSLDIKKTRDTLYPLLSKHVRKFMPDVLNIYDFLDVRHSKLDDFSDFLRLYQLYLAPVYRNIKVVDNSELVSNTKTIPLKLTFQELSTLIQEIYNAPKNVESLNHILNKLIHLILRKNIDSDLVVFMTDLIESEYIEIHYKKSDEINMKLKFCKEYQTGFNYKYIRFIELNFFARYLEYLAKYSYTGLDIQDRDNIELVVPKITSEELPTLLQSLQSQVKKFQSSQKGINHLSLQAIENIVQILRDIFFHSDLLKPESHDSIFILVNKFLNTTFFSSLTEAERKLFMLAIREQILEYFPFNPKISKITPQEILSRIQEIQDNTQDQASFKKITDKLVWMILNTNISLEWVIRFRNLIKYEFKSVDYDNLYDIVKSLNFCKRYINLTKIDILSDILKNISREYIISPNVVRPSQLHTLAYITHDDVNKLKKQLISETSKLKSNDRGYGQIDFNGITNISKTLGMILFRTNILVAKDSDKYLEFIETEIEKYRMNLNKVEQQIFFLIFISEALEYFPFNLDFLDNKNPIFRWFTKVYNGANASDGFYDYFKNEVASTYKHIPVDGFLP